MNKKNNKPLEVPAEILQVYTEIISAAILHPSKDTLELLSYRQFDPQHMPFNMPEYLVDSLYAVYRTGENCNKSTFSAFMTSLIKEDAEPKYTEDTINRIWAHLETNDNDNMALLLTSIDEYQARLNIYAVGDELAKMAQKPLSIDVMMTKMEALVEGAIIGHAVDPQETTERLLMKWDEKLYERTMASLEGKDLFPSFPFGIPINMRIGDLGFITGHTKSGKTSLVIHMADEMASSGAYHVVVVSLENEVSELIDRWMAARNLIPLSALEKGTYTTKEGTFILNKLPQYKKMVEDTKLALQYQKGTIQFRYSQSKSIRDINRIVQIESNRAKSMGKELIVFVDYYNIIEYDEINERGVSVRETDPTRRQNKVATVLKDIALKERCRMIVMGQEHDHKSEVYGGQQIKQRAQWWLRLAMPKRDLPVRNSIITSPEHDFLMFPIKYQYQTPNGYVNGERMIEVVYSNSGSSGDTYPCVFLGAYRAYMEHPNPGNVPQSDFILYQNQPKG